jgi:hypothetical protein
MSEKFNSQKEEVVLSVFKKYFPDAEICEVGLADIPKKVLEYFEFKSSQFLDPDKYKKNNFENFFVVRHRDGLLTYVAQQTKDYNDNDVEKLTFFADYKNDAVVGRAELRLKIKCAKEKEPYFKNKPFVGWIETKENLRKSGLGTKRLFLMNSVSQMCYNLPLYSDTVNSPEMKSLWEELVKSGMATKFKEGDYDRYVVLEKK